MYSNVLKFVYFLLQQVSLLNVSKQSTFHIQQQTYHSTRPHLHPFPVRLK